VNVLVLLTLLAAIVYIGIGCWRLPPVEDVEFDPEDGE